MLVVIASQWDNASYELVERWRAHDARLLTSRDLSCPGWRHSPDSPDLDCAVISGEVVGVHQLAGVVNRLPAVGEEELQHISEEDRRYVASEMNAFLVSWMSALRCPVINRPDPNCLVGPNWREEEWLLLAARLGIRTAPLNRKVARHGTAIGQTEPKAEVTVIGTQCFGDVSEELIVSSQRLAKSAEVSLLSVHFTGPEPGAEFSGVNLRPDLSHPEIADAVLTCIAGVCRC